VQSGVGRGVEGDEPQAHRRRLPPDSGARARRAPDIAISGDFIVGFPGETDADFDATLDLVHASGTRPPSHSSTAAVPAPPPPPCPRQVAEPVKDERLARLQAVINAQQEAFNAACVGRTLPVLWERLGRNPGQIVGRSPYLQGVHTTGPIDLIGRITPAVIGGSTRQSLAGALLREAA
jgi:tRNA-2-methylthio-N6-dimethylallyladenosine synthase